MKQLLMITLLTTTFMSCSYVDSYRQNPDAKTPFDQAENAEDRQITQNIRQALIKERSISLIGKNVKIITQEGRVTLRGPVANQEELRLIAKKALETQGVKEVANQLEVSK